MSQDNAGTLLGMHTTVARELAGLLALAAVTMAIWSLPGPGAAPAVAAGYLALVGAAGLLLTAPGDPIPRWAGVGVALAGPFAAAVILPVLPHPIRDSQQTSFFGAATLCLTFLCVRGGTGLAWSSLGGMLGVTAVWAACTGQPATTAPQLVGINAGPLLMSTLFAYTIRPAAHEIFVLRAESNRQAGAEAAAAAVLRERNTQLDRLDRLARPALDRIATREPLTAQDAGEFGLLETHLRDGLRARGLVHPVIDPAVQAARRRGVTVRLYDDHGLDDVPDAVADRTRRLVAARLRSITRGTVVVRILPPGRPRVLSIVTLEAGGAHRTDVDQAGIEMSRPGDG